MGCPPSRTGDEMLHHRRPDCAGEIIAGRRNGDGDAAPAHEPMRDVGHHRPEGGRAAKPDQALRERDLPQAGGGTDADITGAERSGAGRQRHRHAETVGESAHGHAAAGKAEHGKRVGQRSVRAIDIECGLHGRQRHHHRPHADAADGGERQGRGQPQPGMGGFDAVGGIARLCIHDCAPASRVRS